MPVTAKLSSKFYERFGDDITTELVDWFNAVDSTYQAQLREVNDLNWERFKATLLAESASIRSEMSALRVELRGEFRTGLAELRTEFHTALGAMQRNLLKWMFIYWSGLFVGLGGLIIGLATFLRG